MSEPRLNERDEAALKKGLQLDTLPLEVVNFYKRVKIISSRLDVPITPSVLIIIAAMSHAVREDDVVKVSSKKNEQEVPENREPECEVFYEGCTQDAVVLLDAEVSELGLVCVRFENGEEIEVSENNVHLK